MACKFVFALAALFAAASAEYQYPSSCPKYESDPDYKKAVSAVADATATVSAFVSASAAASASVEAYSKAVTSASTKASSLARTEIFGKLCVAADASSTSSAVAQASAAAYSKAEAAAAAYGVAQASAIAAGRAVADVIAMVCSCSNPTGLSALKAAYAKVDTSLKATASAHAKTCEILASSSSESQSVASSLSSATARVCRECGKGYDRITLKVGSSQTNKASDGSITCDSVAHSIGLC
jgi:hypothetical protein